MYTVVIAIMILVCLSFSIKQTFLKAWQIGLTTAICALFTGMVWPWAIEQSRQQIDAWLANRPLMLDTSVVITIEVLWQMTFCLLAGKIMYSGKLGSKTLWAYRILRFFPGILILAVLFSTEVYLIYMLTGVDFSTTAWSLAAILMVILPTLSWCIKWLIPEKDLRLEILFLCNALLMTLGIVATVNGTTNFKDKSQIEWLALAGFGLLTLVCSTIGYIKYRITIKA